MTTLKEQVNSYVRFIVAKELENNRFNQSKVARDLDISRVTLSKYIDKVWLDEEKRNNRKNQGLFKKSTAEA